MASIKQLKKDIDDQIFGIISDCLLYSGLYPDSHSEELADIIEDAVSLRNDLFARVNNPDGKDNPQVIKKYFAAVKSDLSEGTDKLCQRLSVITRKKK